jgi:hypothetical protein
MELLSRIYDWLTARDFDLALEEARTSVVKRYARGNVNFQGGSILDESGLEVVRQKGDRAVAFLRRELGKHPYAGPARIR